MKRTIYCDNAATTSTREEVIEAMLPVLREDFGNPSSLHKYGRKAKTLLANARKQVAALLNCEPTEVFFTSGGTESNNIAINGTVNYAKKHFPHKKHIISTPLEHSAVYQPIKKLEDEGYEVTWLKVDREGFVDLSELKSSINENTLLVSIMHANNEIGVIQDLEGIGQICKEKGVFFHTDAVQSAGKVEIDVKRFNLDALSISGHKIYGPKGIGILYIRTGAPIEPILFGGSQEKGFKPGTENLPGIVGIGKAVELRKQELMPEMERLRKMQTSLIECLSKIEGLVLNGPQDLNKRVPGNVNVSFEDIDGDSLVLHLDLKGICVSSGSACSEGSIEPSRVIASLYGESHRHYAFNSLRISFGLHNEEEDVEVVANAIEEIAFKMRASKEQPKVA